MNAVCYDAHMTSEGARLKEHLRKVGEVKAASHREATEAHLALPMGERLEQAIQMSDTLLRMHREAGLGGEPAPDDAAAVWAAINEHLRGLDRE